jgi:AraC-like DNA-binding protein
MKKSSSQKTQENLAIFLDSTESRALTDKGVTRLSLGDILFCLDKISLATGPGLHFLLCARGEITITEGPTLQVKDAWLMSSREMLKPVQSTQDNLFIHVGFTEDSPLIPEVAKPMVYKKIAGNPERLCQYLYHFAFDLQSKVPWRRETAVLSAALILRLLEHFLSGLTSSLQEDLKRTFDDFWSRVSVDLSAPWDLEQMSKLYGSSARQFDRHCRLVLKQSPVKYLVTLRLRRAHSFLMSTKMSISEVANQVGYTDPFAFSTAFKRHFGVSPRAARNE